LLAAASLAEAPFCRFAAGRGFAIFSADKKYAKKQRALVRSAEKSYLCNRFEKMISKHVLKAVKKSSSLLAGLLKSCIFAGHFSGGQLCSRLI
jgi:hypothetical protein